MADTINELTRLALFEEWSEHCVWCKRPLAFDVMEVEHLLPKSLSKTDLPPLLTAHGLPADFDLESLENLAPSCRPCNGSKSDRPPPDAPLITSLLRTAGEKAPRVRETATKLTSRRRIARAATILSEGAEAGDKHAVAALRKASESLRLDFQEATGRNLNRLSSMLDPRPGLGVELRRGDRHFTYPAAMHEPGEPSPPVTPGSVMSIFDIRDEAVSRTDVVPRDPEAVKEFGPLLTLLPTEGEAGERAIRLLDAALKEGRSVEIGEGLDLRFDRLPSGLSDLLGQTLTGGKITLSPSEPAEQPALPDWDIEMRVKGAPRDSAVRVLLTRTEPPPGWEQAMTGSYGGMTVTALMRRAGAGGQIRTTFKHQRDSSSVRSQLRALKFLTALSGGGQLIGFDKGKTGRPPLRVAVPEGSVSAETQALMTFLDAVRTVEEWCGFEFELPDELDAGDARLIGELAAMIRRGGRHVTWSEASLVLPADGAAQLRQGGPLRIEEAASSIVLGTELQMGYIRKEIERYKIASEEPDLERPGHVLVRLAPSDQPAANIFEQLVKKPTGAHKPPSPPKKGRRSRRRKGKRR